MPTLTEAATMLPKVVTIWCLAVQGCLWHGSKQTTTLLQAYLLRPVQPCHETLQPGHRLQLSWSLMCQRFNGVTQRMPPSAHRRQGLLLPLLTCVPTSPLRPHLNYPRHRRRW
jgi:hypothetical protein